MKNFKCALGKEISSVRMHRGSAVLYGWPEVAFLKRILERRPNAVRKSNDKGPGVGCPCPVGRCSQTPALGGRAQ